MAALHVLIVDDDPIFRIAAAAAVGAHGHSVDLVEDGLAALEALERKPFDAALIDLAMPEIDGLRLIALMRGLPRWRHLAIIVVTALSDDDELEEARRLGADAVLRKPVVWPRLITDINTCVAQRRARAMPARRPAAS